jgi:Zn finger protein HypA/HybF involved in hydrogenase expression
MASPGIVRLMTDLWEESLDGIYPTVDIETGKVTYPEADARLDERDGSAFEVLEMLAEQDRLHREFQEKQYICPYCDTKGMQYTSACPSCGSPETIRTERYRHTECDHEGIQDQFVGDDGVTCPECEMGLTSLEQLESDAANFCQNCDLIFETAEHRLRCRDCHLVTQPTRATERILYQYYLTDQGEKWVEEQLTARQLVVETFKNRTLRTEIDTTVTTSSGEEVPVHVYAQDELLDDQIIAAVHERPYESDIAHLLTVALDVDAHALLVTTSGTVVGEDIDQLVTDDRLTILEMTKDGALQRDYEIVSDPTARNSFVGRITNIFKPQTG